MFDNNPSVLLIPPEEVGKGYGAKELHDRYLKTLQEKLGSINPELMAVAVSAARAVEIAALNYAVAELEMRRVCGDHTHDAMLMVREEAKRQLTVERMRLELEQQATAKSVERFHVGGDVSVSGPRETQPLELEAVGPVEEVLGPVTTVTHDPSVPPEPSVGGRDSRTSKRK